jgi:hypothetical protein
MEGQSVANSSLVKQLIQEYLKNLHHRFCGLYASVKRVGLWWAGPVDADKDEWLATGTRSKSTAKLIDSPLYGGTLMWPPDLQ